MIMSYRIQNAVSFSESRIFCLWRDAVFFCVKKFDEKAFITVPFILFWESVTRKDIPGYSSNRIL